MTGSMWGKQKTQFFYQLDPELLLGAIDRLSLQTTGHWFFLNSMENRVVQIEVALMPELPAGPWSKKHCIGKFYRPGRWSRDQLLEEHRFCFELQAADIPVVAPLVIDGESLFEVPDIGIHYCLFPSFQGRSPDELLAADYGQLGRLMGRLHTVGERKKNQFRLRLDQTSFGQANLDYLIQNSFLPNHWHREVTAIGKELFPWLEKNMQDEKFIRIHGDCHRGNLLKHLDQFHLVDFDDTVEGLPISDLWPLLPTHPAECPVELAAFLEGYEAFRPFPRQQIKLCNPLRMLRYFHFAGWLAKRWDDPAFKQAFPYFGEEQYWSQWVGDLRQLRAQTFGAQENATSLLDLDTYANETDDDDFGNR